MYIASYRGVVLSSLLGEVTAVTQVIKPTGGL